MKLVQLPWFPAALRWKAMQTQSPPKPRWADGWLGSGSCIVNTDSRDTREGARSQKDEIASASGCCFVPACATAWKLHQGLSEQRGAEKYQLILRRFLPVELIFAQSTTNVWPTSGHMWSLKQDPLDNRLYANGASSLSIIPASSLCFPLCCFFIKCTWSCTFSHARRKKKMQPLSSSPLSAVSVFFFPIYHHWSKGTDSNFMCFHSIPLFAYFFIPLSLFWSRATSQQSIIC